MPRRDPWPFVGPVADAPLIPGVSAGEAAVIVAGVAGALLLAFALGVLLGRHLGAWT